MDVEFYITSSGSSPFYEWFNTLEHKSKVAVMRFIHRVALGGSRKNVASLGKGIWEIKIPYKAMRVFFGKTNGILVLLGVATIELTKYYWRCYAKEK